MADKIYLSSVFAYREDTLANWTKFNPLLERGEISFVRDGVDGKFVKIGDGSTLWNALPYAPLPKGDKGDTGANGKDAITDQTYNPESENAQSGKAVAEALSGAKVNEKWELISERTLTEDAVVSITEDMNKNPINLKKFKVLAVLPQVSTATILWLKLNGLLAIFTEASTTSAKNPSYCIDGDYTFDWQFTTVLNNSNPQNLGFLRSTPYGHRYTSVIPYPCTKIELALNSGMSTALPVGTTISLWGVRA